MSDKLDRQAARERITPVFPKCKACRGNGIVSVKVGQTFETDSPDEHRMAYRDYPCPHCADRKDLSLALAELEAQDALIASQAAEIRLLKAQAAKDEGLMSAQAKAIEALAAEIELWKQSDLYRRKVFVSDAKQWAVAMDQKDQEIRTLREAINTESEMLKRLGRGVSIPIDIALATGNTLADTRLSALGISGRIDAALAQVSASPLPVVADSATTQKPKLSWEDVHSGGRG